MFVTQHWWFARFLFISVLYLNFFFFWSVSMHSSCAKNIHKSYMHSSFFCLILPCIYVMMPKFYRSNVPVHPEYYSDFTVHISNWFLIMFYQTFCKFFFFMFEPTWLHIINNWGCHLFFSWVIYTICFVLRSSALWCVFFNANTSNKKIKK